MYEATGLVSFYIVVHKNVPLLFE